MRVLGYSERGVVYTLFFEIAYSHNPARLLRELFCRARFQVPVPPIQDNDSATLFLEESLSDFGDADVIALLRGRELKWSVFMEAKVKCDRPDWNIRYQFSEFVLGLKFTADSSNLFTQFYHKFALCGCP